MSTPEDGVEERNPLLVMLEGHPQTNSCAKDLQHILNSALVTTVDDLKGWARQECKDPIELQTYVFNNIFKLDVDRPEIQQRSLALKFSQFLWDTFRKDDDS
jgi:hypothetical protein